MTGTIREPDATVMFAEHALRTTCDAVPDSAMSVAKMNVAHTLAAAIGATTSVPVVRTMAELAVEIGGRPESSILGFGDRVPCHMAAWANASIAHGLNYEDNYDEFYFHTGIAVIPPALAVAERAGGVSGREFLATVSLASDLAIRLNRAAHTDPGQTLLDIGWAPEQLFGYVPATAAAARLLGLSVDQLTSAFGLAFCQTAGPIESIVGAGVDKAIYCAHSGMSGVLSALMAARGVRGPARSVDGERGLFAVYFRGREFDRDALTDALGERFEGEGLGHYAYPCSAGMHAFVRAAELMTREHALTDDDIEAVTVHVGPMERDAIGYCDPIKAKRRPDSIAAAQMSLPFTLAATFVQGRPSLSTFLDDGFRDPAVLRVADRIGFIYGPEYGQRRGTPEHRVVLEVRCTDGRRLTYDSVDRRYGNPRNPMSDDEHVAKLRDCLARAEHPMTAPKIDQVVDMLMNLELLDDLDDLVRVLCPPPRARGHAR